MKRFFALIILPIFFASTVIAHDNLAVHPDVISAQSLPLLGPIENIASPYHDISLYFDYGGRYGIRQGSIDEDESSWTGEQGAMPYKKHFYNPRNEAGFLGFFTNAKVYGRGIFSDAVSEYYSGRWGEAYYKLGRALHVLQDMSSPSHVVITSHGSEQKIFDSLGGVVTGYESWVKSVGAFPSAGGLEMPPNLSWDNFVNKVADITYNATLIQGALYENTTTPAGGELAQMFPSVGSAEQGVSFIEYVCANSDLYGPVKYWAISGAGEYNPTALFDWQNDWREVSGGTNGWFYFQYPQEAVPAKYRANRETTMDATGNNAIQNNTKKSLAAIWAIDYGLINLARSYSAGLMKYFSDLVNAPPYLKKVVLSQNGSPVYVAEWGDDVSTRHQIVSVNATIAPDAQLNVELEFSRPMSAVTPSFEHTTSWVEFKNPAFNETKTKWSAYVEGSQVTNISEGSQSLGVTGRDTGVNGGNALDANPETIAMRDASGNLINYEDDFGATNTYTGGSDKTHLLAFQGTPPVVSINSSAGGVCGNVSGISPNTFAGYAGNDFAFMVNDSTTGVKYFKLAKLSGETLLEETLEAPLPYKAWSLPSLGIGTYVLIAEDGLGNRTSVPFRVETLEMELDKATLSGVPAATTEGYARLASARFGVKINSSAGLRSVELRGLEYNGGETPPVEGTLSYTALNGNASYALTHDISGTSASMGGIYKVVAKDLAGNGKTLVVNVSPVSGGVESSCLTQASCQSAEHDLWKVLLHLYPESTIPSSSGIMPGAAILRATPAMEWQYTAIAQSFQEASRHDMGYVDVSVQSDGGGGALPRVDYYEVAGENACPSGALYSYNGCGEGSFGCITPIYSRCGVGTPTVNISVGRFATFTHSAVNANQPALPLGMCPGSCYNVADNTCSCTQSLNVRGSIVNAAVYGISYSTNVETGVVIYPGTNVTVVAAPGLEVEFDEVTGTGGGSLMGYGVFDAAPSGYQRIAEYEISNSVPFSGMAEMKFDYDPSLVNSAQAALAKVFRVVTTGGTIVYEEILTTVDTAAHKIIGHTSGFSRYMAVCPVQAAPNLLNNGTTPSGAPVFSLLSDGIPSVQPVSPLAGEVAGTVRGLLAEGLAPADQLYSVADSTNVYSPYGLLSIAYDESIVLSKNISEESLSLYGFDASGNAERLDCIALDPVANTVSGRVYSPKAYYAVLAPTTPVPLPAVDNEAPATVATHVTPAYKPNPYVVYTSSSVALALDAYDMPADTSVTVGVQATYYKVSPDSTTINAGLNGNTTQYYSLYTSTLSLVFAEGRNLLVYGSVDNNGLYEPLEMESIYVDLTPPVSRFEIAGSSLVVEEKLYVAPTSTITLAASDPLSNGVASGIKRIYYLVGRSIDECLAPPTFTDAPGTCDNPLYSGPFSLPIGTHTIQYLAEDNVGNAETPKSVIVYVPPAIDLTPPVTYLEFYGARESESGVYLNAGTTVAIEAMDPVDASGFASGVDDIYYLVDADIAVSTPLPYSQGFSLVEGTHTIAYTSADKFRNFDVLRSSTVLVDATPPSAQMDISGSSSEVSGILYIDTSASISLSAMDPVSNGVASGLMMGLVLIDTPPDSCQTDPDFTGPVGTCKNPRYSNPFSLVAGTHTVYCSAMDNAGNMAEIRAVLFNVSATTGVALPIIPSSGPIGVPFTLEGTGFGTYSAGTTVVSIGATTAPLTLWTDTKIQGTIPGALAAGQYPVSVKRGAAVLAEVSPFTVTQPAFHTLTPSSGAIGVPFTITGENFGNYVAGFTRVLLGGATMPLTLWTDTKIQGTIPGVLGPGEYPVIVERQINGGIVQSQALAFTVSTPTVYNMTPSSGPIGLPFTINGESFGNYSAAYTGVLINGTTVPLTLWTDTKIQGTIPGNLAPGQYPVMVGRMTADGGMVGSNALTFEVVGVNVASMTPVAGPIGMPFTIYGGNFGNYSAGYTKVLMGGTTCPLTLWTDTKIQGTVPGSLTAGDYQMIVERSLNGGQVQSVPVAFAVTAPEAYSFSPSSGPIGLPFTIMGANFGNYVANYNKVLIGGAAAPLTLWTDTKIQGTIPGSLVDGDHEVIVERALNGGVVRTSTFTFTAGTPYLDTVTPSTASVIAPFTITGYNFGNYVANYTKVLINGTTTALTLWTDTKIQGRLPYLLAGTYPVQVQRYLNGGLAESATAYINVEEPVISSMTPVSGAVGTVFNLYGTGFGPYDATIAKVFLGGTQCALSLWTDTKITCTVPSGLSYGTHTVVAMRGQAVSNGLEFYIPGGYNPSMMRPGTGPSALEFKLGEVYVYPDPAKGGKVPTFHIEVGTADSVKLKVYTVAGQLAHERTLTGSPQAVGAVYAYEYAWTGRIASGVYYYTIEAERAGKKLKAKGKFSVVR